MASIVRHRRRNDFTILPNKALRDSRVSFRATGLLCYLLALPDGSSVDSEILAARKPEGRDAIRHALRELISAGYVNRHKEQSAVDGLWTTVTVVTDDPELLSPTTGFQSPGPEKPSSEPTTGYPTSESQALKALRTELQNENSDSPAPNGAAVAEPPTTLPAEQVARNLDELTKIRATRQQERLQRDKSSG